MKVAITGHTKGIGKAIADLYPEHIGFSRSNGYDITNEADRTRILSETEDCDVFINNAWDVNAQTEMYKNQFEKWKADKNKTIVNINSRAKYLGGTDEEYYNSKIELFEEDAKNMFVRECRIININPGFVMTETSKKDIEELNMPYMSTQTCAEYVAWAINQPMEIYELSFWKL